eukprot:268268-Rhodomonas_salina.8
MPHLSCRGSSLVLGGLDILEMCPEIAKVLSVEYPCLVGERINIIPHEQAQKYGTRAGCKGEHLHAASCISDRIYNLDDVATLRCSKMKDFHPMLESL